MLSMEGTRNTREYIYFYTPLYMQPATARVTRVWLWLAATPPLKTKRCSLARQLCLCLLALSRGLSARVKASISLQPSIHSILPTRLIPTSPSPSTCPSPSTPIHPPSPHRYANTGDFACQAVHTNPSQTTPAAPRGGAASVITAHPPRCCCCLPPSISRRSRSAQGALTTA